MGARLRRHQQGLDPVRRRWRGRHRRRLAGGALIALVLILAAALWLLPAGAASAQKRRCPVKTEQARYEDGLVQLFSARRKVRTDFDLLACVRGGRRPVTVAYESSDPNANVGAGVEAVFGGRYVWTSESHTFGESADVAVHNVVDLGSRKGVTVSLSDEDGTFDTAAIPAGLVVAEEGALALHPIAGERRVLGEGAAAAPAVAGTTLYWRAGDAVRTLAVDAGGEALPARAPRAARRRSRCLPRGRVPLLREGATVVSRTAGGRVTACTGKQGRQRRLNLPEGATATGPPEAMRLVDGGTKLFYRRPVTTPAGPATAVVVMGVRRGRILRSAVVPGLTEAIEVYDGFAYTDGTALTVVDGRGAREVARGSAIAGLASTRSERLDFRRMLYWADGAQAAGVDLDAPPA